MPNIGEEVGPSHRDVKRGVWLRFNADGLLLTGLLFFSGLDVFTPHLSDVVEKTGDVPPSFYVWTTCYLAAAFLMLGGFVWQRIAPELLGRLLMCTGYLIETVRVGLEGGWLDAAELENLAIGVALTATSIIRASALLSRHGLIVVIGGRRP